MISFWSNLINCHSYFLHSLHFIAHLTVQHKQKISIPDISSKKNLGIRAEKYLWLSHGSCTILGYIISLKQPHISIYRRNIWISCVGIKYYAHKLLHRWRGPKYIPMLFHESQQSRPCHGHSVLPLTCISSPPPHILWTQPKLLHLKGILGIFKALCRFPRPWKAF